MQTDIYPINDFGPLMKGLVLVSFVMGAVTGVAMWFTSIQVIPRTIGLMVSSFHVTVHGLWR